MVFFTTIISVKGQESDSCIIIKRIPVYKSSDSSFTNLLDSVVNYEEFFIKKTPDKKLVFLIDANTYEYDSIVKITLYSNPKVFDSFPEGIIYYRDYSFYMYDGFAQIAKKSKLIKRIKKEPFSIVSRDCYLIDLSDTVTWYWKCICGNYIFIRKNEYRY